LSCFLVSCLVLSLHSRGWLTRPSTGARTKSFKMRSIPWLPRVCASRYLIYCLQRDRPVDWDVQVHPRGKATARL
jgi:hypothetical protein